MLTCPLCKKSLRELDRQCPSCRADVSLLADYVGGLEDGLERAEALTQAGHLGEAVWAYLEVLEVDPDNPPARQQVGQVVRAVRAFDREAPGRRWLARLRRERGVEGGPYAWLVWALAALLVLGALLAGFALGYRLGRQGAALGQGAAGPGRNVPLALQ